MKVLITGFDAFNKDTYNPSFEAIKMLPDMINNYEIIKKQLNTKYIDAQSQLELLMSEHHPDFVILCGQAAGREKVSLENVALNVMNSTIFDNANYMPKDEVIIEGGPYAYTSSIDLIKLEKNLNDLNIPTYISYHAGTFVCNSTYYKLLNLINTTYSNTQGVFVHVPIIESQLINYKESTPTMSLEMIQEAFNAIISSLTI